MPEEDVASAAHPSWVVYPNPDLLDLIPGFLQNRRNDLQQILRAIEGSDFASVCRFGHTWKGICRPYGFNHLEDLSLKLEDAGLSENAAKLGDIATEIADYLDTVRVL